MLVVVADVAVELASSEYSKNTRTGHHCYRVACWSLPSKQRRRIGLLFGLEWKGEEQTYCRENSTPVVARMWFGLQLKPM